jgi:hypothetical protein
MNLDELDLRTLQKEAARAISTIEATNDNIYQFNMAARHNSQNWYKAVIEHYVKKYGDLPSKAGPGKNINLVSEQ